MNTNNGQNARMRASRHRVVIYAERTDGEDVTEDELRGIMRTLESKGFNGYYERTPPHRILEVAREMARVLTT